MYLITAFIQSFWRGQHTIGQPQFPASFGMLPRELVLGIAKHLDLESLSHLSQTCKGLHGLLDPEITKLAPRAALSRRGAYSTSFIYEDDQEHGVDLGSFGVRVRSRHDSTIFHRRPTSPVSEPSTSEPLGWVIYQGKYDAVQNLLKRGANPNAYLANGPRMLSVAVDSGNVEILKLLLKFGARPCLRDPRLCTSPLDRAAFKGEIDMVREMLLADRNVDSCITLHDAVYYRKEIVELLIPHMDKSMFNDGNLGGLTPLQLAMRDACIDTAIYLIGVLGVEIDKQDVNGWTALHYAMDRHILVQTLIEAGANIHTTVFRSGYNSLHVALRTVGLTAELSIVLRELLRHGADVNCISTSGTPVHCAVRTRSKSVVDVLLFESPTRPDLTIRDGYGQTPIDLAFCCGYNEIGQALMEYQRKFSM